MSWNWRPDGEWNLVRGAARRAPSGWQASTSRDPSLRLGRASFTATWMSSITNTCAVAQHELSGGAAIGNRQKSAPGGRRALSAPPPARMMGSTIAMQLSSALWASPAKQIGASSSCRSCAEGQ